MTKKILEGQKALVTGSSSGIGRGVALALAKAGADVMINYAGSKEKAEKVAQEVSQWGGKVLVAKADVSNEADVQAMFQQMFQEFGTIDILVNNAGLQKDAPFHEMTLENWNKVIGINLTGQFLCAREAVREFLGLEVQRYEKLL